MSFGQTGLGFSGGFGGGGGTDIWGGLGDIAGTVLGGLLGPGGRWGPDLPTQPLAQPWAQPAPTQASALPAMPSFDIPGLDIMPQGAATTECGMFKPPRAPAVARPRRARPNKTVLTTNPGNGAPEFFGYLGKPLLFQRDLDAMGELRKLNSKLNTLCGTRTVPRRRSRKR